MQLEGLTCRGVTGNAICVDGRGSILVKVAMRWRQKLLGVWTCPGARGDSPESTCDPIFRFVSGDGAPSRVVLSVDLPWSDRWCHLGRRDVALVKAAMRGVKEQLGVNLPWSDGWTRLVELHYSRPPDRSNGSPQRVRKFLSC